MSKEEHRIYFSSNYSIHSKNQGAFTVNLPFPLELKGKWKCAIVDIFVKVENFVTDTILYFK